MSNPVPIAFAAALNMGLTQIRAIHAALSEFPDYTQLAASHGLNLAIKDLESSHVFLMEEICHSFK